MVRVGKTIRGLNVDWEGDGKIVHVNMFYKNERRGKFELGAAKHAVQDLEKIWRKMGYREVDVIPMSKRSEEFWKKVGYDCSKSRCRKRL